MLVPLLWLAFQVPLQVSDITEMGCQGPRCVSLADIAQLRPDQLPAGCQLQMLPIVGYSMPNEPVLICEAAPQPAAGPAAAQRRKTPSRDESPRAVRAVASRH